MINIDNYYLNIEKINELKKPEDRSRIYDFYRDMVYSHEEKRPSIAQSFFNTLYHSGYLIDLREEKLDTLLDDNSISS